MKSSTASNLRRLLGRREALLLPGVHDALTARLAERAGVEAVYLSGSALAMAALGLPDIGLVTASETIGEARRIAEVISVPLVCDADTGYGNPLNVARTVRALGAAGVAGIQLEDQDFPKRCGHFEGKDLIPREEMVMKIRAAVEAREDPDLVIIARTDARAVLDLEAAIERSLAYREAGADVLFVEAPRTVDELREIGQRVPGPLLVNVVEGGLTPQLPFDEYEALGFHVILYPTAAVRVVARAAAGFYAVLRKERTTRGIIDTMVGFEERNEINDLARYAELERRYATGAARPQRRKT